jgi:hypothetical protein
MSPKIWDALYKLGPPAGNKGVLQVLVLYPAEPTKAMMEKLRKSKGAPKLPDAIVGLSALASKQEPLDIGQALMSVISAQAQSSRVPV